MSAAVVCLQTSSVTNNILQPPANLTKIRNAKIFMERNNHENHYEHLVQQYVPSD